MIRRKQIFLLLPIVSLVLLTACTTEDTTNNVNQNNDQEQTQIDSSSSVVDQELTLDTHKCIGCGRCSRFDQEHFTQSGEIASVVSQDNLESQNLQTAISACPVDAIKIS